MITNDANDPVIVEHHNDVALIRLNRPANRNALALEIKAQLETRVPALMRDDRVRCLIITGTDTSFCAGGDISNMSDRSAPAVRARMYQSYAWAKCILTGEKPVVAAVNGVAAGAGFSLALLCDFVIVSDKASFRAAFPALGAVPDLGLALTLTRSVGTSRAKDILLSNRRIDPAEAVTMGIAKLMVPAATLIDDAMKLARDLAAGPATSFGLTKMLVNNAFGPIEDFLGIEAMAQAVAFGSREFAEGVDAFLGKRKADFKNS